MINRISDVTFVKGASDFRVFRKSVRDSMLEMHERNRFTKGIFSYVGFNTHYIPYRAEERAQGTSKWNVKALFKYAINGILAFSSLPLKISTYLGGLTIVGSIVYLIIALILKEAIKTIMLFFLMSFFAGVQLLMIGVISEYVRLMCGEVRKRPVYIAKNILVSKNYKN